MKYFQITYEKGLCKAKNKAVMYKKTIKTNTVFHRNDCESNRRTLIQA